MKKTIITSAVMAASLSVASAATYMLSDGSTDYTIVEADPFANGGSAGNTTAVGGGFFSASSQSTSAWRNRTISPFNSGYQSIAGATNRVFDNTSSAPEIVTSVSGLAANTYNVYVVYLFGDPDGTQGNSSAGVQAMLNGSVDGTSYRANDIAFQISQPTDTNQQWATGLALLGTTAANSTGFTVNIDDAETLTGGAAANRADYIGVAYSAIPVPEPSSTALLGLGGLALILRRRK